MRKKGSQLSLPVAFLESMTKRAAVTTEEEKGRRANSVYQIIIVNEKQPYRAPLLMHIFVISADPIHAYVFSEVASCNKV